MKLELEVYLLQFIVILVCNILARVLLKSFVMRVFSVSEETADNVLLFLVSVPILYYSEFMLR